MDERHFALDSVWPGSASTETETGVPILTDRASISNTARSTQSTLRSAIRKRLSPGVHCLPVRHHLLRDLATPRRPEPSVRRACPRALQRVGSGLRDVPEGKPSPCGGGERRVTEPPGREVLLLTR